jgi:hypothetical protein
MSYMQIWGRMAPQGETGPRGRDLVDTKTAARILGLRNYHTLEVWRSANRHPELRFHRVGRSIRYRIADLHAFLDASAVGGGNALGTEPAENCAGGRR